MNIITLLNQIKNQEIVLPAIQRNFVWDEEKIQKLLDSILRGYPIGIILMWETYNDIQYRRFDEAVGSTSPTDFLENKKKQRLKVVLDGQQRLQSLYVALYGKYQGKSLYFDVLSGRVSDNFEEDKYSFEFMTDSESEKRNNDTSMSVSYGEEGELRYFLKVSDLFSKTASEKKKLRTEIIEKLNLSDENQLSEEEDRLEVNTGKLDGVLTKEVNILKALVIDENKPQDSPERQTDSDVLEIFYRINRQGTPLNRSELIFSMMKLNWKESSTALPEFVERINQGNSFGLDIDFVIRALFAVSGLGTKFDVDLLRKKSNMEKVRSSFEKCCEAIQSTIDNVQQHCRISSSKILGGDANLIPFVYYFFHCPKLQLPNSEIVNFRKSLFLCGFTQPFRRWADSRLGLFIRNELSHLSNNEQQTFPIERLIVWINYWESVDGWDRRLVQRNSELAACVIQQQSGTKTHFNLNTQEMDHIFPRSKLREKNFEAADVNHFANLWLLPKGKNINKYNRHPKDYLQDVPDKELKRALIDRELLDYRRYRTFLRTREEEIITILEKRIGLSDKDFKFLRDQDGD
ncbi:MAG: DUF262 domain-containing protein [Aestuariivita sp.]|nr:DUF262 domain-containing protein [Aestuariivita sp.]